MPPQGSLGLLALGHVGVEAWREARDAAAQTDGASASAPASPALPPVVIASGLPRSGTSMLMQMLVAGGLEVYSDGLRTSDESNPRGYLEHERVKALKRDNTWVAEASGRALKVVTPLIALLPSDLPCVVLEMVRDLDEVIASQETMLQRSGEAAAEASALKAVYSQSRREAETWVQAAPHAERLAVEHRDVLESPRDAAERIAAFLAPFGFPLNAEAMAAVVDPTLYRERTDG